MRVVLDVYADAGHLHGLLRSTEHGRPLAFSGVLDLVSALEQLDPEPAPDVDGTPASSDSAATTEVLP